MKYNFRNVSGFLIVMSVFLIAGYSNARAQTNQTNCGQKKADRFLVQGGEAYGRQDYTQAVAFFDQSAKAAPKCAEPFFQKALALLDAKKYDESAAAFQESIRRGFGEPFRAYLGICQARYFLGNYPEALKNCEESTRLDPNFHWTFYYTALAQVELGNFDKALTAIRRAAEINSTELRILLLKARILNTLKKYDETIPDLLAANKLDSGNDETLLLLGVNYFLLKDYARAVEYLSQSLKANPENFDGWTILSSAHVALSVNWEKAEEAARQAVRIKPADADANFQLGLAQLVNGRLDAAIKSLDAAIRYKNTLAASALVYKGYALIGLKRAAEAEKLFQQALTVKPTNKIDYFSLAEIYFYRWELDKARAELKKSIDFANDDEDWQEYSSMSWNYSLANQPQQAIIAANEAIQLNPKNDVGYTNRCRAYNETNLPDIAIQDCRKALEMKPNDGEVFFYLGRAYALKKDEAQEKLYNRKAIAAMERRLGLSFDQPKGGANTGGTPASPDNGRVSINSPSYSYYVYLLGNAYYLDENFEAAAGAYQKIVDLRPSFPRLRYNLALSYLKFKKPDLKSAAAQYDALLAIDKNLAASLKKAIDGYRRKK